MRYCPACGRELFGGRLLVGQCLCGWPDTTPEAEAIESLDARRQEDHEGEERHEQD